MAICSSTPSPGQVRNAMRLLLARTLFLFALTGASAPVQSQTDGKSRSLPSVQPTPMGTASSTVFRGVHIGQPLSEALAVVKKLGFKKVEQTPYDKDTYTFRCISKEKTPNFVY